MPTPSIGSVPPGGDQFPFVETIPFSVVSGNAAPGANFPAFYRKRVAKAITVSNITIYVATQVGNIDVGIYQSDGTTLTKIASSGSTAVGSASAKQVVALTASVSLVPGVDYYFAVVADNTSSIGRTAALISTAIGAVDNMALTKALAFPLPATSTLASLSGIASIFWMRAS